MGDSDRWESSNGQKPYLSFELQSCKPSGARSELLCKITIQFKQYWEPPSCDHCVWSLDCCLTLWSSFRCFHIGCVLLPSCLGSMWQDFHSDYMLYCIFSCISCSRRSTWNGWNHYMDWHRNADIAILYDDFNCNFHWDWRLRLLGCINLWGNYILKQNIS